jgi:hypothetical protein
MEDMVVMEGSMLPADANHIHRKKIGREWSRKETRQVAVCGRLQGRFEEIESGSHSAITSQPAVIIGDFQALSQSVAFLGSGSSVSREPPPPE